MIMLFENFLPDANMAILLVVGTDVHLALAKVNPESSFIAQFLRQLCNLNRDLLFGATQMIKSLTNATSPSPSPSGGPEFVCQR